MARRRAIAPTPERLAEAKAFHAAAMARLRARIAGTPLPPRPESSAAQPSTTPQQAYRNTSRLLGEGDEN